MSTIMDSFMKQQKVSKELEKFNPNLVTNIVTKFIYDHNLMQYKDCIRKVNYWAFMVNSPAPTGKWELIHEIENLINSKNDMIYDLLDSDQVSKSDKDKFNDEFHRLVDPLYNAVYDL